MIGKIARVPLRDVWKHEAYDLTRWLEQNIDVFSDAVGLPLANPEREQAAGTFSVDLVAEDAAGNPVVIENQLGKTDHDHLGKLLTYMVTVGAKTAIWVAAEPRSEHVSTVAWLNESSAASFYLLKIEAIRIGDSPQHRGVGLLRSLGTLSDNSMSGNSAGKIRINMHHFILGRTYKF